MSSNKTNSLLKQKAVLQSRIEQGSAAPAAPDHLSLESIEVIAHVFQHREDAQWVSDDHVQTLVKSMRNSTKGAKKKPLEPLTVFWVGNAWALIDGHHRYKAYKAVVYMDPVPVTVFSGTLDEALAQALRGNSKDKLPMSKSEKTNAAWRLVISTGLSLNQLVAASTISKPTIVLMRKAMQFLKQSAHEIDLDELSWHDALRKYHGKELEEFEPDLKWRDKRVAKVAQALSDTFGGEFKRKPELFWDAVRKFDSNLTDYFLKMHGIDPEDFSWKHVPEDF